MFSLSMYLMRYAPLNSTPKNRVKLFKPISAALHRHHEKGRIKNKILFSFKIMIMQKNISYIWARQMFCNNSYIIIIINLFLSIQEIKQNWNWFENVNVKVRDKDGIIVQVNFFRQISSFFVIFFFLFSKLRDFLFHFLREKGNLNFFFRSLGYTMLISWKEGIFHSQQQY